MPTSAASRLLQPALSFGFFLSLSLSLHNLFVAISTQFGYKSKGFLRPFHDTHLCLRSTFCSWAAGPDEHYMCSAMFPVSRRSDLQVGQYCRDANSHHQFYVYVHTQTHTHTQTQARVCAHMHMNARNCVHMQASTRHKTLTHTCRTGICSCAYIFWYVSVFAYLYLYEWVCVCV